MSSKSEELTDIIQRREQSVVMSKEYKSGSMRKA
jgi:hypothetical protein